MIEIFRKGCALLLLVPFVISCEYDKTSKSTHQIPHFPSHQIKLDGRVLEKEWRNALKIDTLCSMGNPSLCNTNTVTRIFYDDTHLNVSAILHNENIRAELKDRDSKLYKEHCFELFFDPGLDGLNYYELEINPLCTVFDLILKTSNHRNPDNIAEWHIPQEQFAVFIDGTLNDSSDTDKYWSIEMQIPWSLMKEGKPNKNDAWKFNILRMDYSNSNVDMWSWKETSPKNIHIPHKWGLLKF